MYEQAPPSYASTYTNENTQLLAPPHHRTGKTTVDNGHGCGPLTIVLGLLFLVTTPLLFVVLAREPTLPPDNAVCQNFIHNWENRIQGLRFEEGSLENRLDDMKRKLENFDRDLRERLERERLERERARLYWGELHSDPHCSSSGHRIYHARLLNLGSSWSINGIDACKNTPATINGITYVTPTTCEDRGYMGGVWGSWLAKDEVQCTGYWEFIKDKGCIAPHSGLRRYETKLGVVHEGESPEMLCSTTPVTINGQVYQHPYSCPDWGKYGFWGIWNIPDEECQ